MSQKKLGNLVLRDAPEGAPQLYWIDPESITPNENNWRIHTEEQRTLVSDLIKGLGWADVTLFNRRTGEFVNGHLRRDVAIKEGLRSIPVLVGDWSPEEQATIHASLDMSTGMAKADPALLARIVGRSRAPTPASADIIRRLAEKYGAKFDPPADDGDDDPDGGDGEGDDTAEDQAAKVAGLLAKWGVESGQVWAVRSKDGIRTHKIMCGDATSIDDVARLFGTDRAAVLFTSPPYGDQRAYDGREIDWDKLICSMFDRLAGSVLDQGQVFVNLGLIHRDAEWVAYWDEAFKYASDIGWRKFGWYVWDQTSGLPGMWHGRLAPSFEFVFHFNRVMREPHQIEPCKGAGDMHTYHHFRTGENEIVKYKSKKNYGIRRPSGDKEPDNEKVQEPVKDFKIPDSVVRVVRANSAGIAHLHPAIYPTKLPRKFIESYSDEGNIVYDPFCGTLSTILACEASGRAGRGMEIVPKYVAIGLERLHLAGFAPQRIG